MNNKGFGVIEILIVIVVLGVIGIAAFKNYGGNTVQSAKTGERQIQKSKELEGKMFINSLVNAEKTYYALNGRYVYTGWANSNAALGINTSGNSYFKEFAVEKNGDGFIVKVKGSKELEGVILTSE